MQFSVTGPKQDEVMLITIFTGIMHVHTCIVLVSQLFLPTESR